MVSRRDGYRHVVDFNIDHFHDLSHTPLLLDNGAELTFFDTSAALDALSLVDHMRHFDGAFDSAHRAGTCAKGAAFALICQNSDLHQMFADAGRTFFVDHMGNIFVTK